MNASDSEQQEPCLPPSLPESAELAAVITAWPTLPEPVKAGILAMVKAVKP